MDTHRQHFHYFGHGTVVQCPDSYRTYPPKILFALLFDRGRPIHWARNSTTGYAVVSRVEGRLPELYDEYDYLGSRSTEKNTGRVTIPARLTDQGIDQQYYEALPSPKREQCLALHNRIALEDQFTVDDRLHWLSSEQLLRAGQNLSTDIETQRKQAICYVISDRQFTRFKEDSDPGPKKLINEFTDFKSVDSSTVSWAFFMGQISPPTDYPVDIGSKQVYVELIDDIDAGTTRSICLSLENYRRWLFKGATG